MYADEFNPVRPALLPGEQHPNLALIYLPRAPRRSIASLCPCRASEHSHGHVVLRILSPHYEITKVAKSNSVLVRLLDSNSNSVRRFFNSNFYRFRVYILAPYNHRFFHSSFRNAGAVLERVTRQDPLATWALPP